MAKKKKDRSRSENDGMLWSSLAMLCFGTSGGWALTSTIAGPSASNEFLWLSLAITALAFLLEVTLYLSAKKRLVYKPLFGGVIILSLAWYMLCLFVPIFWMEDIDGSIKVLLVVVAIFLFVANGIEGFCHFNDRWRMVDPVYEKNYDHRSGSLDWDKVLKPLRISVRIYVPGVPELLIQVASVLLILSMLVGLNLRKVFPVFSVFAWGIPCLVASSCLVQMAAICVAQAVRVVDLEKKLGEKLRPKA